MATKNISITEEAYKRLASQRERNESFSEIINKLTGKVRLKDFFGILSRESADKLEKGIERVRKEREKFYRERVERIKKTFR